MLSRNIILLKETIATELTGIIFLIINTESNWNKQKIKEALYINALNPQEQIIDILNMEKGLKIESDVN
jgi:hypothetical protein